MTEEARRFFELFRGLDRAHGTYAVPPGPAPEGKKLEGRATTERSPPTAELAERHLAGERSLGVVPICADDTCRFGAVDVDVYPLDHGALVATVERLKLPVVVCRTKSGGAHLYLFLAEPVPAALVRSKLMEWAIALGYAGVEVFPKQVRLASERDVGNWINLPYFANERTTRYAFDRVGQALPLAGFLHQAEARRVTEAQLRSFELPPDGRLDLFVDGPPCLQTLAVKGFGDWQNNGLFNVAVYLRKRYGDQWRAHLDEYNHRLMVPPVGHLDVASTARSVGKRDYFYTCSQDPVRGVCNKQVCLTRQFGIGAGSDDPGVALGTLVKLETTPPTFIWDVNGKRLELRAEELMSQGAFQKRCVEDLTIWPQTVRPQTWVKLVREALEKAEVQEVPVDATEDGQLLEQLARFAYGQVEATKLEEIRLGRAFTHEGRTYFRATDFLSYLKSNGVHGITTRTLYKTFNRLKLQHHFKLLLGGGTNFWSITELPGRQTEKFTPPRPAGPPF